MKIVLGILSVLLMFASIGVLTIVLIKRKTKNKRMLAWLVIGWVVLLFAGGACLAIATAGDYVPANKIYKGYWYNPDTGGRVRDEYEYVGGEGMHPVGTLIIYPIMTAIIGLMYASSITFGKEKAQQKAIGKDRVLAFFLWGFLGALTGGIMPFLHLLGRLPDGSRADEQLPDRPQAYESVWVEREL
jgi:Na+/proline symporter